MVIPPAAMFAADAATASFSGMMPAASHLPGTALTGSTGVMMMNADTDESAGWTSHSADVASNYLSAKPTQMVSYSYWYSHVDISINFHKVSRWIYFCQRL